MASLTLKNLPENLLGELREAAVTERRSLNQQALYLLVQALHERRRRVHGPDHAQAEQQLAAWRALAGNWESDEPEAAEVKRVYARRTRGRKVEL